MNEQEGAYVDQSRSGLTNEIIEYENDAGLRRRKVQHPDRKGTGENLE